MVLAKIEEVTMARQGNTRMKRKKTSDMLSDGRGGAGGDAVQEPPYINPEQKLGKNFAKLSSWTKSMLQLLLSYLEPGVFRANPLDSQRLMQQLVEFGLELQVIGDGCDKVKAENKKQVYERLKCLYLRLGSRLRSVSVQDGQVNWAASGFYSLKKTLLSNKLVVTDRVSGRSADIDDLSDKDLPDTLYIEKNWNRQAAHIILADGSTLLMVDWFPKRRCLSRRLSDELDVTCLYKLLGCIQRLHTTSQCGYARHAAAHFNGFSSLRKLPCLSAISYLRWGQQDSLAELEWCSVHVDENQERESGPLVFWQLRELLLAVISSLKQQKWQNWFQRFGKSDSYEALLVDAGGDLRDWRPSTLSCARAGLSAERTRWCKLEMTVSSLALLVLFLDYTHRLKGHCRQQSKNVLADIFRKTLLREHGETVQVAFLLGDESWLSCCHRTVTNGRCKHVCEVLSGVGASV
eukprot:6492170-Amphidinium_carterae.1